MKGAVKKGGSQFIDHKKMKIALVRGSYAPKKLYSYPYNKDYFEW